MSSLFNTIFLGVNKSLQNGALSKLRMVFFVVLKTASAYSKAQPLTWDAEKGQREQKQHPRDLHGGWMSCEQQSLAFAQETQPGFSPQVATTLLCVPAPLGGCVCLCMFIFALSTLILEQHFQPFVSVAVSVEVSCAASQEWCFFINGSHEKFRCVRYTLWVLILSEICDRFLLKDHRKFLQAKEPLYKLLSDFLCVHLSLPGFVFSWEKHWMKCFHSGKALPLFLCFTQVKHH